MHDLADDLDTLLHQANIQPPFLIVAHSFGSLVSRLWASRRKEDVIGMVLLDPASEEQEQVILPLLSKEERTSYMAQFTAECTHEDFEQMLRTIKEEQTHYGMMPFLSFHQAKAACFIQHMKLGSGFINECSHCHPKADGFRRRTARTIFITMNHILCSLRFMMCGVQQNSLSLIIKQLTKTKLLDRTSVKEFFHYTVGAD